MKIHRRTFGKLVGSIPAFGLWEGVPAQADSSFAEGTPAATAPLTQTSAPWYVTNRRWTTFNLHIQDWDPALASRLSAAEVIREVLESNANVFMMFALDCLGNAYYPSRVARKHPNLRDDHLLPEIVAACKQHGIAVVLYCCVNWNRYVAQHHPEWTMKDNQNKTPGYDGILGPYLCYNSGYLDFLKSASSEMLDYNPEGMFYDMLWYGEGTVCYCQENCQPLFREKYGIDMPLQPTWDEAWRKFLEFRYDSNIRFAQELTTHATKQRAGVSVGFNYHGQPRFSWQNAMQPVRHRQISDYGTGETATFVGGAWFPSMLTTYAKGLKPGSPVMMATNRCLGGGYSDFTMRPEADLKWEVFTFLSHGAHAFVIDDATHDGSLQPEFYILLGRVFAEVKQKEPYFGHMPVREVGLYYSLKSRDWYGRDKPERYQDAFIGAFRALKELHIPVDILFDESISLDQLRTYPVVFLPNTAILDVHETALFKEYVKKGGQLLSTLDTSLFDGDGKMLKDFTLADLFGVRYKGKVDYATHYYRLPKPWLGTDASPTWDVLSPGEANLAESQGAETYGELKLAFYDGPPFHPLDIGPHNSAGKTISTALYVNRYGEGQSCYIPFAPDAAYVGKYPLPEHRKLLGNVIRSLWPKPELEMEAPLTVEVVPTEDRATGRHIIHFIGYQAGRVVDAVGSPRIPNVMEEPLLYRAKVRLARTPREVTALGEKTRISQEGNRIDLQIEDIHEAIIISYGSM